MPLEVRGAVQQHQGYLDALRGVALLWIMLEHLALLPSPPLVLPSWLALLSVSGSMGVELIFVVSAFALCQAAALTPASRNSWLGFMVRRIFRIAPLFYLALVLMLVWNPWNRAVGIGEIMANLLFVFNFVPGLQPSIVMFGWIFGILLPIYAVLPFLISRVDGAWPAVTLFALSVLIAEIARMAASEYTPDGAAYMLYSVFNKLPIFAAGIFAWHALPLLQRNPQSRAIGFALLAIVPVVFLAIQFGRAPLIDPYFWRGPMFVALLLGAALAVPVWLVNAPLQALGEMIIAVYVVHGPVIVLLTPVYRGLEASGISATGSFLTGLVLTLLITIPVAILLNRLVERPATDYGRRLAYRLESAGPSGRAGFFAQTRR